MKLTKVWYSKKKDSIYLDCPAIPEDDTEFKKKKYSWNGKLPPDAVLIYEGRNQRVMLKTLEPYFIKEYP